MEIKPRLFYRVVKIQGRPRPLNDEQLSTRVSLYILFVNISYYYFLQKYQISKEIFYIRNAQFSSLVFGGYHKQ